MKLRAKLLLTAMTPLSLSLTACGAPKVRLALPPAELTTCAAEPEPPALPAQDWSSLEAARPVQMLRDSLTIDWVLALRSAWGDCRAKVDGVKAWRDGVGG